jgi:succinyl-CoA synthetase alpha subunit
MKRIPAHKGMFAHMIKTARPDLIEQIEKDQEIQTMIIGLGKQGTRHAGMMRDFGTTVTAGVAAGKGGQRIHETIPVYDNVADCLAEHPHIAAASIWRHYTTARASALEVIEAGVPLVVLISEFIPLRDVRDILAAARAHGTTLIGGNTPGVIFPPEGIKVGMLPDVFYPEEVSPGEAGPRGVTIISRSGAILYHMSDGLASAGIAQNAVLGVGGDGAIGSTFRSLVPMAQAYEHTDLVVVAGEIGGSQEELLAEDMQAHPENYPKPVVALISGNHAPEGKTMGHAGAIVSPGQEYGTYASKRRALEAAGVTVVNSQPDLIKAVQEKLAGKTYFETARYYDKMKKTWEQAKKKAQWGTVITEVVPNSLKVSGYKLSEVIERSTLLEAAHLLVRSELPNEAQLALHRKSALAAACLPAPSVTRFVGEDISRTLARCLLGDLPLREISQEGKDGPVAKTVFAMGRMARYLASILGNEEALDQTTEEDSFQDVIYRSLTGEAKVDPARARLLEAMVVASVDHGVTPPSAQATILAASVRPEYEMAIASGVGAITDVHGGAGAKAASFLRSCVEKSKGLDGDLVKATQERLTEAMKSGKRIEGLGHRVHTQDPRRDVLWGLSKSSGLAGPCVEISEQIGDIFEQLKGMSLPINVDGVIGAIVADLGLGVDLAKAIFVYGRVAGLSAHYFEEIVSQSPMRRINFGDAAYRGKRERAFPR